MRRSGIVLALAVTVVVASAAAADQGHKRPKITVMRWEDPPVTAADEGY